MSRDRQPRVVVVGAGYVGLTLALHMASSGMSVLAVDVDEQKIADLKRGETAIFENGIKDTLQRCVVERRLSFSTTCPPGAAVWIIAVSYFPGEAEGFLPVLDNVQGANGEPPLVMIRGTVPIGYTRAYVLPRLEKRLGGGVDEAFCLVNAPERTLSGAALQELSQLPQLVGGSPKSVETAIGLFEGARMQCVALPSLEAAEIAKTFTNFARLVQFNLANFLGVLCHEWNLSEEVVKAAITSDYPRLGFLSPAGPGVGGFCLPKDCLVLHDGLRDVMSHFLLGDYPSREHALNEEIIRFHEDRVVRLVDGARRILALGVAFKGRPQTDDTRGSVGVRIVQALLAAGADVRVHDRVVDAGALRALGFALAPMPPTLQDDDAVLLLNNDPEYRRILAAALPRTGGVTVRLYDPWRLVVREAETIFQPRYPLSAALRAIS
jgi:UDP-N-acetyl-D-mannosaminuronic acid dehydrogenase